MTKISHSYNRLAPTYDRRWHRYLEETLPPVTEILSDPRPLQLLDVACGTGELIRRLLVATPKATFVGVDASVGMLRIAKEKLRHEPRVTLQQASADSLPFPDGRFNWAISCNSFHCFHNPHKVVSEMIRVLKPGGGVLILDWCRDSWVCRIVNQWLYRFDRTHVRMYTTRELRHLLTKQDVTIRHLKRFRISCFLGFRVWEMMLFEGVSPPS